jgi:hypothetical protein
MMITRAQAEALLTLAESLETCERLNVRLRLRNQTIDLQCASGFRAHVVTGLTSRDIRTAVADMIPKHTGS